MPLEIEAISVTANGRRLVDDVTFSVAPGQVTVLLGPNGAGKSTLLRAVCGLVAHQGGVTWQGRRLAQDDRALRAKTIAYVPQTQMAHWPISARTAIAIGRMPHGAALSRLNSDDVTAIDRALAAVDAERFADQAITTLSGGERARVLLARALAVEAPVMLLDEPVAALDPHHQLAIADLLAERARAGAAVLAVVHDLALTARLADTVAVMDRGRLVANGAPRAVLTDALLAEVFAISAHWIDRGDASMLVPDAVIPPLSYGG